MKVLLLNCRVASKKSLKLSLVLNAKSGKTSIECHCHRMAIGLIFLLIVVWVVFFVLFFPLIFC